MRRLVRVFSRVVYFYTLLVGIFLGSVLFVPLAFSAGPANNQEGGISLSIRDGRMDMALTGESMLHVLEEVARQTGISVFVEKTLLDTTRTVHFRNLTVEEGLKRIVGRESYAMVFSAERDSYGNYPVKAIRVYPKGKADAGRYMQLRPSGSGQRSGEIVEYSREEVDAILARNDEIFQVRCGTKN